MINEDLLKNVKEVFGVKILQFKSYKHLMESGIYHLDAYEYLYNNNVHYIRNSYDDDSNPNYLRIYKTNNGFYFNSERMSEEELLKDIRTLKIKNILHE